MNVVEQLTDMIVRIGSLTEVPSVTDNLVLYNRMIENLYFDMQTQQYLPGVDASLQTQSRNWLMLTDAHYRKFMPTNVREFASGLRTLCPANHRHVVGSWSYDHPVPQIAALVAAWKYWLYEITDGNPDSHRIAGHLPENVKAALVFIYPFNTRPSKGSKPQHTDLLPRPALVYVAAPYSAPAHFSPEDARTLIAQRMMTFSQFIAHLLKTGEHPVSPLLNHWVVEQAGDAVGNDWAAWQAYSETLLARCDAVYVLKLAGWEDSHGILGERRLAAKLKKPVRFWDITSTGWQVN